MGIGDWGLGPIPNPQSPIPNPQSPIPNNFINYIKNKYIIYYLLKIIIHLIYFENKIILHNFNKINKIYN